MLYPRQRSMLGFEWSWCRGSRNRLYPAGDISMFDIPGSLIRYNIWRICSWGSSRPKELQKPVSCCSRLSPRRNFLVCRHHNSLPFPGNGYRKYERRTGSCPGIVSMNLESMNISYFDPLPKRCRIRLGKRRLTSHLQSSQTASMYPHTL
jgi:hypothetical protein